MKGKRPGRSAASSKEESEWENILVERKKRIGEKTTYKSFRGRPRGARKVHSGRKDISESVQEGTGSRQYGVKNSTPKGGSRLEARPGGGEAG